MTELAEAPEVDFGDDDDGAEAFYSHITGKAAVEPPEGETPEEVVEVDPSDEAAVAAEAAAVVPPEADDEGEVELTYGTDKKKVSVKDIKRLMEAETSITTKAAAVTAAEGVALARTQRAETALGAMLKRAQTAFEPYSKLNFLALAKDPNVSAETLEAVQKEAQSAYDAVQYFQTELTGITEKATADMHAANNRAAGEAVKVLNDKASPSHIPGFGKDVYDSIVNFAAAQGMDRTNTMGITNPAHLKILHMAMEFQKAQKAAVTKVAKVISKPTKVLRPSAASSSSTTSQKSTDAIARLRRSGSEEDAADAFMASFNSKD